ncbi:MAG: hypothetical protein RL706_1885 [Pseudomonadota bacterium]|jgi:hypothetical protein
MTIALFGISSIYNGFQKFMHAAAHLDAMAGSRSSNTSSPALTQHPTKLPALRVLRVSEHGQTSACAGRMVISGRMADVCAELDRLVALEAKNKPSLPH